MFLNISVVVALRKRKSFQTTERLVFFQLECLAASLDDEMAMIE